MRRNLQLRTTVSAAAVIGAVAFGFAGAAAAQEAPATVDDIIVTAQKREQSLQDVPVVVTSLSEEALEKAGVTTVKSPADLGRAITARPVAYTHTRPSENP